MLFCYFFKKSYYPSFILCGTRLRKLLKAYGGPRTAYRSQALSFHHVGPRDETRQAWRQVPLSAKPPSHPGRFQTPNLSSFATAALRRRLYITLTLLDESQEGGGMCWAFSSQEAEAGD